MKHLIVMNSDMEHIMAWYTMSYSVLLGLAGIFFTLFTVIYALIDNKKSSISFLESKRKRGIASPRQKADLKYWNDYKSSLRTLNNHVLALFIISVILCLVFVVLSFKNIHYQWLTWSLVGIESLMGGYIVYVFAKFIVSYFKSMKD